MFRNFRLPGQAGGGIGALLARKGRVALVGPEKEVLREWGWRDLPEVDLRGGYLFPGFRDAHGHLFWLGKELLEVDLTGARSWGEVLDLVAARARSLPPGTWILGGGWDPEKWSAGEGPNLEDLSRAAPENPVWLVRRDGHAGIASPLALEAAGVKKETPDPAGGRILRDEGGAPTGVLVDQAMELVERVLPGADARVEKERFLAARDRCLRAGLTAVGEAGVTSLQVSVLEDLRREGELGLRVYAMRLPGKEEEGEGIPWEPSGRAGDLLQVRALKLFADGSLGSRSAAMFEPFEGEEENRGILLLEAREIARWARASLEKGFQLCVHAIGDRALAAVLEGYEEALEGRERPSLPFRVEHVQTRRKGDLERMKALGVVPSLQPAHLLSDGHWAREALGPDRWLLSYGLADFVEAGLRPAGGSDFPVEPPDPLRGFYAAVTGGGGLRPDQALSREAALELFTSWAAGGTGEERICGKVEPGYACDFTVLDRDILTCPVEEIREARVLATVVEGRVFHHEA